MAEFSELWALGMLLAAFAGGAFGAAIGALPAFIFTGFMVMAGETAVIIDADIDFITGSIAFGPVFGPHISFAAGAAASAYAAKKGYMDTGFAYHEAKNIAFALGPKPDVLVVGGLFGILGYWITTISSALALPWDAIAIGVVLSAFAHRLFLGYSIAGEAPNGRLNMSPFEQEEHRPGLEAAGSGERRPYPVPRLLVEPWLGHQYKWGDVSILGIVVGILAAFITIETGSVFLPFGISAASLLFLNCGVPKIPVTHHISLVASTAVVAAGGTEWGLSSALLLGALFGVISALFGELIQRLFYAHADTHLDPPAAAIVLGTLLIAILAILGIFPDSAWVPMPF